MNVYMYVLFSVACFIGELGYGVDQWRFVGRILMNLGSEKWSSAAVDDMSLSDCHEKP